MSYRYYVGNRSPIALWMLDDSPSFQEEVGMGLTGDTVAGSTAATTAPPLVAGASFSSVFDNSHRARFQCPVFKQGQEFYQFAIEAWVLPVPSAAPSAQKVLSRSGSYDGITLTGTLLKFTIDFVSAPSAECSYDIMVNRAVHVVGVYTKEQIMLYVDGELVDDFVLTEEQKVDEFASSDGYLYVGESSSSQKVAVNAVAIYGKTPMETFALNFDAGRRVVGQSRAGAQFGAKMLSIVSSQGTKYLDQSWSDKTDFSTGYIQDVELSETAVRPRDFEGVSVPGSWTCGVPIDGVGLTSIYGVSVEWSGVGVTAEASLDGTDWEEIENRSLVPMLSPGHDPTDEDIQVRFSFSGGLEEDPAFLEHVRIIGFKDATVDTSEVRAISYTYPGVLREDYEPIEYRDNNGLSLNGGTLTIGPDISDEPDDIRTIEMWLKPAGTTTWNVTGTKYINGIADSGSLKTGQWSLVHIVTSSSHDTAITITGDCVVGQVNLYSTPLSSAKVLHMYRSYLGFPSIRVDDTASLSVSETAVPASMYAHAWSIDGAGG